MDRGEREKALLAVVDDTYMSLELLLRHVDETVKLAKTGEMLQCLDNLHTLHHNLTSMLDGNSLSDTSSPPLGSINLDHACESNRVISEVKESEAVH